MIGSLARDSIRLLLRGRAFFLLLAVGLLTGLFVRATRDTGARSLHGAELEGAAVETLFGSLFLVSLIFGIVAGLLLAGEDRGSGFLAQVATRPVRRLTFVLGRLLGLAGSVALAVVVLAAPAFLVAGLSARDIPELRRKIRPERVTIGTEELAGGEIGQIVRGRPGRFHFAAGAVPDAALRLRPKVAFGAAFSGRLDLSVTLERDGGTRETRSPPPFRPLRELPIHFGDTPLETPFVLEIAALEATFLLEVDRESLTTTGAAAPFALDLIGSLVMIALAALTGASLAFLFGVGLSAGPASLAASFVVLIGLGREAVLDIVAGIGASDQSVGEDPGAFVGWLRSFLSFVVRLVPDFDSFSPAERIGDGDALSATTFLLAVASAAIVCLVVLFLTAAVLPLKEH